MIVTLSPPVEISMGRKLNCSKTDVLSGVVKRVGCVSFSSQEAADDVPAAVSDDRPEDVPEDVPEDGAWLDFEGVLASGCCLSAEVWKA